MKKMLYFMFSSILLFSFNGTVFLSEYSEKNQSGYMVSSDIRDFSGTDYFFVGNIKVKTRKHDEKGWAERCLKIHTTPQKMSRLKWIEDPYFAKHGSYIHEEWKREFNKIDLSKILKKSTIEELLQTFSDHVYGQGFKYIGVEQDFFHGHILFRKKHPSGEEPFAILYHTQEDAFAYFRCFPDHKYDYLNPETRNWIQWINPDSNRVENAINFQLEEYVGQKMKLFESKTLPVYEYHFTIASEMLDAQLTGDEIIATRQFEFHKADCKKTNPEDTESNVIKIDFKDKAPVCLYLTMNIHHVQQ